MYLFLRCLSNEPAVIKDLTSFPVALRCWVSPCSPQENLPLQQGNNIAAARLVNAMMSQNEVA